MTHKLAIFASGSGSNALKIIEYAEKTEAYQVVLVVSNKADAGVLDIAARHGIATQVISRKVFMETEDLLEDLRKFGVSHIVLAGFLWLVPLYLLRAFPNKIVNIHPSLLPKYGGKGMHGMYVHEAVKAAGEKESGMTIHLVNEEYDKGEILFQDSCAVLPADSAADIARKVLVLEHKNYPEIIASWVTRMPG